MKTTFIMEGKLEMLKNYHPFKKKPFVFLENRQK